MAPITYEDKEEAYSLTFKDFVSTHVRFYEPALFKSLVDDWDAVKKWDIDYLGEKVGEEVV